MPRIAAVHIYPVKSLHGLSPDYLDLRPWGPDGDRLWLVIDPDDRLITQRECPEMALVTPHLMAEGLTLTRLGVPDCPVDFPGEDAALRAVTVWNDSVMARDAGDPAALWLSAALGRVCRLVYMHEPASARALPGDGPSASVSFADAFPVLIANTASLDALNQRLDVSIPMTRFRPNIVLEDTEAWEEDGWQRVQIGTATLRIVSPCARCKITTIDQETGDIADPKQPLAELAQFRRASGGVMFAQNAEIETPGRVSVGDEVIVLERGPSNLT